MSAPNRSLTILTLCCTLLVSFVPSPQACFAQIVWSGQGTNDNWTTGENWSGGIAPTSSASTFIRFQGTIRPTPLTDTNAPWILNRIDFESRVNPDAHSFVLSGNPLSFQGSAPQIYCYATTAQTINNDIIIPSTGLKADGLTIGSLILNGHLSGTGTLTIGYTTVILTNSNTYQGVTTVGVPDSQGYLTVSNNLALGSTDNGVVLNLGSQLRLKGGITVAGESLAMGSGSDGGLINISENNAWNGPISLSFTSTIQSMTAGKTLTVGGDIDGAGSLLQSRGVGDLVFSGALRNLDLEKMGTGTLTLSGSNSDFRVVELWDGLLVVSRASSLPPATPVQFIATQNTHPILRIEEDTTIRTLEATYYGGDQVVELGSHTLTINEDHTSSYIGAITGTGALIKTGSGVLQISGNSSYSGGTFIELGTVRIFQDAALGTPPDVAAVNITIEGGGVLETVNCTQVTLDPRRIIKLNGGCSFAALGCTNSTPFIIPGQITGPGFLVTFGPGIVELANPNNNYLGTTLVHEGTLQLDFPGSLGGNGASLEVHPTGVVAAGYPIDQSFLTRIASVSAGTIALATDSPNDLDFAEANLDQVTLSARGVRSFSGTITPANNAYRLGGGDGVLILPNQDQLSGKASLHIGRDASILGTVLLSNNNTLRDDTIVHGGALQIDTAILSCNALEINTQAKTQLASATLNADVIINTGGSLVGCGTITGNLTNSGTVTIDCAAGLQLAATTTNNGTMTFLGGATLTTDGPFTNNGILDLLTSFGTVVPTNLINNGTIIYPGAIRVRSFSKVGPTFAIRVQTFTGHNYQLQRSLSLAGNGWQNIGNSRPGNAGSDIVFSDNNVPANRAFYRVIASP